MRYANGDAIPRAAAGRSALRATGRAGFTLIEVIVAITLTAIVLAIAAAALGAASSARARVEAHQRRGEADARLRSLLIDMLRHAPAGDAVDEPLLRIERNGTTELTLVFLSTGVREPFGTGGVWRVRVQRDSRALRVDAEPIASGATAGRASAPALHMELAGVDAFDVRVLEAARQGEHAAWRSDWPIVRALPQLIEVRIAGAELAAAPFVVSLSPLEPTQ